MDERRPSNPIDETPPPSEYETDSDGFLRQTFAEAVALAGVKGCYVRTPGPRELFIDIDSEEANARFKRQLGALPTDFVERVESTPSPSGAPGRYHKVVTIARDVKGETERVLLQAALGSDLMRELLSWRRIDNGSEAKAVSLFFEKAEL